ncbi:MAG: carboxypeptidase-like regulatory domain-containing protein [Capnocytophaga sp.]|nr:carboxypeptidase-like regulatory domain-containing protein [Capnocytophaga sp.]
MKKLFFLISIILPFYIAAQEDMQVKGTVFTVQNNLPLENVNVLNLNQVKGTTTNIKGEFNIRAAVNDTLYFSFLGFKSIKVRVTQDMIKYPGTRIGMTELAYALEEVIITPYKLTGYLAIDAKYIPVNPQLQYSISGLNMGYESRGSSSPSTVGKVLSAISNPAGFLYNTFSSRAKDLKKLKKMKENDEIRNLLLTKYDRETLCQMLNIEKTELEDLLRHCNYSKEFIRDANDLQFLEALSNCYEEYKVLKK